MAGDQILNSFTIIITLTVACGLQYCANKESCCLIGKEYKDNSLIMSVPLNRESCMNVICEKGTMVRSRNADCFNIKKSDRTRRSVQLKRALQTTTTRPTTTTTVMYITPLYCFFADPVSKETHVWRGGTNHTMADGRRCRCEWWGRVNCHSPQRVRAISTTPVTTTTEMFITPMYCFYSDPVSNRMIVWRGGTEHHMEDGRLCRCEWWGRVNCHLIVT